MPLLIIYAVLVAAAIYQGKNGGFDHEQAGLENIVRIPEYRAYPGTGGGTEKRRKPVSRKPLCTIAQTRNMMPMCAASADTLKTSRRTARRKTAGDSAPDVAG